MVQHRARKRTVTLSTGETLEVIVGMGSRRYYPDVAHCRVCDRTATEVELRPCTMWLRRRVDGHRYRRCGWFVCAAHSWPQRDGTWHCQLHGVPDGGRPPP